MSEQEALTRAAKFADQVVRVIPQRTDGTPAPTGFGLVLGERAGRVYIATPYHVAFGLERPSSLGATPEIAFRGDRYNTIQARRLEVASERDDLAVLVVTPPQGLALPRAPMVLAAGVEHSGVIGIVLQDAADYSLLLPVERIVQVFTAWDLPVNLLTSSADASGGLRAHDTFKECDNCPEMVVVPAGSFTMGSPDSEDGRDKNEGPQHRVTFSQQFAVGKFAVTFDEWDTCVAEGGCNSYKPNDEGWGRGRRPVINVSWNDANAYAAWLSGKTGRPYRILSEAEREYVTRAGTNTPFWWGSSISTQQANYDGNYTYGAGAKGANRKQTVPVDAFRPNPWGLFQVHGNVWDWTQDCWNQNYAGAPADGSAWMTGDCAGHFIRGSSFYNPPWTLRAAVRAFRRRNSTARAAGCLSVIRFAHDKGRYHA